jgi:hypothetical protein
MSDRYRTHRISWCRLPLQAGRLSESRWATKAHLRCIDGKGPATMFAALASLYETFILSRLSSQEKLDTSICVRPAIGLPDRTRVHHWVVAEHAERWDQIDIPVLTGRSPGCRRRGAGFTVWRVEGVVAHSEPVRGSTPRRTRHSASTYPRPSRWACPSHQPPSRPASTRRTGSRPGPMFSQRGPVSA